MAILVLSRVRHALARTVFGSSLAGDGLLVRIRTTSIALFSLVTAVALGLVFFISQQGWPGSVNAPIPAGPASGVVRNDPITLSRAPSPAQLAVSGSAPPAGPRSTSAASPQHGSTATGGGSGPDGPHQVVSVAVAAHPTSSSPQQAPTSAPAPTSPAPAAGAQPPAPATTPTELPETAPSTPAGEVGAGEEDGSGGAGGEPPAEPDSPEEQPATPEEQPATPEEQPAPEEQPTSPEAPQGTWEERPDSGGEEACCLDSQQMEPDDVEGSVWGWLPGDVKQDWGHH